MSRIANKPVNLPKGVEFAVNGNAVSVKGGKGSLELKVHDSVTIDRQDDKVMFSAANDDPSALAIAGTTRVLVDNMIEGVSKGFERRLQLVGVGYRAAVKGSTINLTLGFSHPVEYPLPEGIAAETPSQTEIVLRGSNKQLLGQVAAEIRAFRPPEPYKGKGIRYSDEKVRRKEAKKK